MVVQGRGPGRHNPLTGIEDVVGFAEADAVGLTGQSIGKQRATPRINFRHFYGGPPLLLLEYQHVHVLRQIPQG